MKKSLWWEGLREMATVGVLKVLKRFTKTLLLHAASHTVVTKWQNWCQQQSLRKPGNAVWFLKTPFSEGLMCLLWPEVTSAEQNTYSQSKWSCSPLCTHPCQRCSPDTDIKQPVFHVFNGRFWIMSLWLNIPVHTISVFMYFTFFDQKCLDLSLAKLNQGTKLSLYQRLKWLTNAHISLGTSCSASALNQWKPCDVWVNRQQQRC